ncbi:hypothetical protein C1645_789108 [Glomus cerebriforme]|uniref:Uncharacterized protein n=1 Tax=Glomus cerebriforme TaxID=658196 RepID=A0A397S974_9GLOM|nr:hypothetical protein C1645_789108 [Glomus cerebriforme]
MEPGDDFQTNHDGRMQKSEEMNIYNISNTNDTELSSTTRENLVTSSDDDNSENVNKNNEEDISHDDVFKALKIKVEEGNKLSLENEELKKEISSLKRSIKYYQKNYVDNNKYKNLHDENQELIQKLNESNKELQNYKNYHESFNKEIRELQKELDTKNEDISDLKESNAILKEEASKYQSALGAAANFRTSDDKNHSVQLKKDILSLQDTIEIYVTNLKGNIEVNFEEVKKLLQYYGYHKITTESQSKPFIKAILQRFVLDIIFEQARKYFENKDTTSLETVVLVKSLDLCSTLREFSEARNGTDTITPISSIKIRQEACVALSNRGFSEIIENSKTIEHNFIEFVKQILNKSLDKYRTINDPAKKQSVENMAANIIREVVRLFWFRLRAQEPIIKSSWIDPHIKIDPKTMTGRWEKGEEDIDNLIVDLCYFPMIGLDLDNPTKRKLYTRAKVFPRYKEKANSYASLFSNMVKSVMTTETKPESPTQHAENDSEHKS